MNYKIVAIFIFAWINVYSQISTDTFLIKKIPVTFSISAEGFVLSKTIEEKNPFYHASAMAQTIITANIGSNVRIPLKVTGEVWNFSHPYGETQNLKTWIKPSIFASIKIFPLFDSVNINAGDLGRVKHGQGLNIDYFESHGGEFSGYKDEVSLSAKLIGVGLDGTDDLYLYSISYKNKYSVRYFNNYYQQHYVKNIDIFSTDCYLNLNKNIDLFAETGYNIGTSGKAMLICSKLLWHKLRNKLDVNLEFRHYDEKYFTENQTPPYQYFSSLTALDKPVNHYYIYYLRHKRHDVIAARIKGTWYAYKDFFFECDLEPMAGTINLFAYDISFGVEAVKGVSFKTGLLNKFFVLPGNEFYYFYPSTRTEMFTINDKLWLYVKANFSL